MDFLRTPNCKSYQCQCCHRLQHIGFPLGNTLLKDELEFHGDVMTPVELENVSVQYRQFESASRSIKVDLLKSSWGSSKSKLALSEISLRVSKNEVLGIVGRNGSGKSTLVKSVVGSVKPTSGWVRTDGILTAMVELGSGLNLDMTAYENVKLHSALYDLDEAHESRAARVSSWAGTGENLHEPLRTYSSGMLARFAFSLNTDINPDILILDEILSVGDFNFQIKSFERTVDLMAGGCAVMLVSHDMELIKRMCTRVIWLERGKIICDGDPSEVTSKYLGSM
jgi:ABC-type polysaccharide/polyol phosphate transport system ATPase subunit